MVRQVLIARLSVIFIVLATYLTVSPCASAQEGLRSSAAGAGATGPGIYLVFPFENSDSSPRLDWIGEGLEELAIERLLSAGQQVYSHDGRTSELDRYGLPPAAKLSHASMLRVAQDLDADFVILGSYSSDGRTLSISARVLRVTPTELLDPQKESGTLDSLMDLQTRLVWKLLSANDAKFHTTLGDFSKRQSPLRLDAFEHYVRGRLAGEDEARIREMREAARLEPQWAAPDFALGEVYFARRDCDSAIPWFARVPKTHEKYVEALFSTGVCRLQMNQPERAEEIFTALQETLRHGDSGGPRVDTIVAGADLPEILDDLAIARARQGKTPAAQADLRRASEIDPDEDDYYFNLGLLALRGGDFSAAAGYFHKAAEQEPENAEDRALSIYSLEKSGKKAEADEERESAVETFGPNGLPTVKFDAKGEVLARLDRIKSELDITALRLDLQAGTVPANAAAPATANTAASHLRSGRQDFAAGRLDPAETEFKAVLAIDAANATAHRSLGEIARRRGRLDEAVRELQASLVTRDSAVVRTILARVYLEQKKPDLARSEAEKALKLAPNYAEAKTLLERLNGAKPAGGAR
ncbi:MAG TPA: tetratricopeptide repeat protein [Candidatus Saccharimonadales bacterium]|nr:tetratricopeptide repeat protein [Candidatus Saccharimonadales bacterium]